MNNQINKSKGPGVYIPPPLFYVLIFIAALFIQKRIPISDTLFHSLAIKVVGVFFLKKGKNIQTSNSDKGNLLQQLHKQIMCFKNWLRGTHLYCSKIYLQTYIDEYVFRFNRRNSRTSIFNSIIFKFMNAVPKTYKDLIATCALNT